MMASMPDPDASAEEPNLGLLLFIPYRAMESAAQAALEEAGHHLPINEARVFQRIAPGGSRLVDLAESAQVSKQTIGSIVDRLVAAGYVERVPDPDDARARLVRITPLGQQLVRITLPAVREVEQQWAAHLGPRRTRQLRAALTALREVTDPYA